MLETIDLQLQSSINLFFDNLKEEFQLTRREGEILQMLTLNGWTHQELGAALYLSGKTIKNHVAHIQRKFNVNSSREIQAVVFRNLLLPSFLGTSNVTQKSDEGKGMRPYVALSS